MRFTAAVALAILSTASSQPHGHPAHHAAHAAVHKKRGGLVTEWVTEWVTTTVVKWVDELPTEAPHVAPAVPTTSDVPAQFFESATTTVAPVAPPPPPPPPPSSSAAPAVSPPEGGISTDRVSAQQNTGELTFYDLGLGACGDNDGGKGETENIVALSHLYMGAQSNGNPYCGKTITIQYNGKTTTAVVKDKCMGCAYGDIDVSRHCFKEFAAESDGRIPVTWWVN